MRLPARMRTWGKRGYGLLEDWVVVLGSLEVKAYLSLLEISARDVDSARSPQYYGGFVVMYFRLS